MVLLFPLSPELGRCGTRVLSNMVDENPVIHCYCDPGGTWPRSVFATSSFPKHNEGNMHNSAAAPQEENYLSLSAAILT